MTSKTKPIIKQRRKRIILGLFSVLTLCAFLSISLLISYVSLPSGYSLTRTHVKQSDLTYQQHLDNQLATQEAQFTQGITTNTPEPDAFSLTATVLIGQLTSDAKAIEEFQSRTPNNFELTATQLIGQLTSDAGFLTAVANGTTTPFSIDKLVDQWATKIEDRTKVTHPAIQRSIETIFSHYSDNLINANLTQLTVEHHMYDSSHKTYHAITIETGPSHNHSSPYGNHGELLVFDTSEETPILLLQKSLDYMYFLTSDGNIFSDINQTGYVNLVISYRHYEDCPIVGVVIVEFTGDALVALSPTPIEVDGRTYVDYSLTRSESDNSIMIEAFVSTQSGRTSTSCPITAQEFSYEWNGERYALVVQD